VYLSSPLVIAFTFRAATACADFGSKLLTQLGLHMMLALERADAQQSADLPPRADILIALAHAANVSI